MKSRRSRVRQELSIRAAPVAGLPATNKRVWGSALLLAVITFAVYSPVLKFPFVNYDDVDYVTENPHIQEGITPAMLRWAVTSNAQANWHPLTWISHALDCQLFGLDAAGHHLTSLLLHMANSVLLFLLLKYATGKIGRSLFVAALFALHPINVESVAWVAERKTALCMFFFLFALGAYGWYARKPGVGRYLMVALLALLALAAKPMAVTFPFVFLLVDIWPLHRVEHWFTPSRSFPVPQLSIRQLCMEKLPFVALSVLSSGLTLMAQRPAMKTIAAVPFGQRLANAIFSYVMYIWKAFWPVHLSVFYAPQGARLRIWQIALCLVVLGIISALVWSLRARAYLPVGWMWFLGTLVPMIGLVQVGEQGMADRYAYLPFLGIFTMVSWGGAELCDKKISDKKISVRAQIAASAAVLLVLTVLTWRQVHTWQSSFVLWSHSLDVTSDNYVAEDFVGTTLLSEAFKATGESCADQALVHFQNAVRINPEDALGHLNVGFCDQGRGRLPDAIQEYQIALKWVRNKYLRSRAEINLGAAYEDLGAFQSARSYFEQALQIYPREPEILQDLAKVDAEEKLVELAKLASTQPSSALFLQLGELQQSLGRIPAARASYEQALHLDPQMLQARSALNAIEKKP